MSTQRQRFPRELVTGLQQFQPKIWVKNKSTLASAGKYWFLQKRYLRNNVQNILSFYRGHIVSTQDKLTQKLTKV